MTKIEKIVLGIATLALAVAVGVAISVLGGDEKVGAPATAPSGNTAYTNYDNIQLDNGTIDARAGTTTFTSFAGGTSLLYQTIGTRDYAFVNGTCADATTTIFAIPNPFGAATTSVTDFIVNVSGNATSSVRIDVGTSSAISINPSGIIGDARVAGAANIINSSVLATGTKAFLMQGSSVAGLRGEAAGNGFVAVGLSPNYYVLGYASTTIDDVSDGASGTQGALYTAAIIGANNTFACTYSGTFVKD